MAKYGLNFKVFKNPREGIGYATDKYCERCGAVSSAFLTIDQGRAGYEVVICKGCLLAGIDLINKDILEQTEKRV